MAPATPAQSAPTEVVQLVATALPGKHQLVFRDGGSCAFPESVIVARVVTQGPSDLSSNPAAVLLTTSSAKHIIQAKIYQ